MLGLSSIVTAAGEGGGYLDGVGYREQALQQAKGAHFQSEGTSGVSIASFGGGTNIFVQGVGMADDPQSNVVAMFSSDYDREFLCPRLTEDDAFLSNTPSGTLVYRLPAPHVLMGVPSEALGTYNAMTFTVRVQAVKPDFIEWLSCKNTNNCRVVFQRHYTPVLKYISPPVVYQDAEVQLIFDPKSIMNKIKDVASDDLPFVQAKIGLANINFEDYVRSDQGFRGWYNNPVRGIVGDQKISKNLDVKMLWETGYAIHDPVSMKSCNYDASECYTAKTVPAIYSIDQKESYTTGGQVITVKGFGFGRGTIKPTIDGVDCTVLSQSSDAFTCRAGTKAAASVLINKVAIVNDAGEPVLNEAGEATFTETPIRFVGQQGLTERRFNKWNWHHTWHYMRRMDDPKQWTDRLAMHFEGHESIGSYIATLYRGWFTPPATTKYRFHITCDDHCDLRLGNTPGQTTDVTERLNVDHWSEFERVSFSTNGGATRISEFVSMEAGQKYYIESAHLNGHGGSHFSLGVEIEQDTLNPNHPKNQKEIQRLSFHTVDQREMSRITVKNFDSGTFRFQFTSPELKRSVSEECKANMSAAEISNKIKGYYNSVGVNPVVTKKTLNAAGEPTDGGLEVCRGDRCVEYRGLQTQTKSGKTCMAWAAQDPHTHTNTPEAHPDKGLDSNYCRNPTSDKSGLWCYTTDAESRWENCDMLEPTAADKITTNVYEIQIDRLVASETTTDIKIAKATTKAEFTVERNVVVSGKALTGKWKIKCVYEDGAVAYTKPLKMDASSHTIFRHISEHCPKMRNTIMVYEQDKLYPHHSIGRDFYIDFASYNGDIGQFEVVSDEEEPLDGEVTYSASTPVEYGKNLVFYPIPFEMLETYEETPQMLVEIDDMPAVCHSMDCGFKYIPAVGEVTAFTFDDATDKLTITGTQLPTTVSGIQSLTFAQSGCRVIVPTEAMAAKAAADTACRVETPDAKCDSEAQLSGTEIQCTLDRQPVCGSWTPALTTALGNIPNNAESVQPLAVACTIASAVPGTDLNLLGQDNLTFTGTNFPHEVEGNTFELTFDNVAKTPCLVQSSSTTELVCLTTLFDPQFHADKTYNFGVVINGQTVTNSVSFKTKATIQGSSDLQPNSVSPVLKTPVTIRLGSDFPYALVASDFSVNATNTKTPTYIRYLNVLDVNDPEPYETQVGICVQNDDNGTPVDNGFKTTKPSITTEDQCKLECTGLGDTACVANQWIAATSECIFFSTGSLVLKGSGSVDKKCNIKQFKSIRAMFGGAETGLFQMSIRHRVYGLVNTENMVLDVSSRVTSISPKIGSIYGGTLVTITGTNFGTQKTDNPVQLSTHGGIGSIDCYVQTIQVDQITCRVETNMKAPKEDNTDAELIVFLKTSEEAICDETTVCNWKYSSSVPTVTEMTSEFDIDNGKWLVKVVGTGFAGVADLQINGVSQLSVTQTDTMLTFTVTEVQDLVSTDVNLFFPIGLPAGHDIIKAGVTLTPKLISLTPNAGTPGGTLITAQIPGIGMATTGLDLVRASNGNSICRDEGSSKKYAFEVAGFGSKGVTAYGVFQCWSRIENFGLDTVLDISVKHGETTHVCAAVDATKCKYTQTNDGDGTFPVVKSLAKTGTTLVFTGENFYTVGYTAVATYNKIKATSVVVDSATQATATWEGGLPIYTKVDQERDERANLVFKLDNTNSVFRAVNTGDDIKNFVNPFSLTTSTAGLSCSFNGGCKMEMTGTEGVQTLFRAAPKDNYIKVCEQKCAFNDADSTPGKISCTLPAVPTTYSNQNYQIGKVEQELNSGVYFGVEDANIAFDGSVFTRVNDNSKTCIVGMEFKAGYVGSIKQAKYFVNYITNRDQYENNLVFEGYNEANAEGEQVTELFKVDESVHEGWNYVDFEEGSYPNFRYYRFRGLGGADGPCRLHEVTLSGMEVIENNDATYQCKPQLVLAGQEPVEFTNAVTFRGDATPLLSSISPRFGTRLGGDVVTFTGTQFDTDHTKYTILIDGVACVASAATTTSVTCQTGERSSLVESSLSIFITGKGLVSTNDLTFTYVFLWSDGGKTWGGELEPMEDESIVVPKGFNLLVDIDKTPKLKAVIVQGAIIFAPKADPNHQRTFDAHYIFIDGGSMEMGTAEFPYTSKLTMTMHSNIDDPYIPIYGNKCIGLRYGTLDMHGVPKTPTWTTMEATVERGATAIQLHEAVDWVAGDQISIASTSYNPREGERAFIKSVDRTNPDRPILQLEAPLLYRHYAEDYEVGTQEPREFISMRAEVGVLSRNLIYRGDPNTSIDTEYGATIFMHSPGDDSLTFRASDVEFTHVGQAFKLGRYALHMHMIGAVHNSYIKNNAIHQSNNRAVAIHGTRYLRIINNVAFEAKGHNIFIEDAVETHNIITHNLIMKVIRSMSLLNVDQTPAGSWITNPFNNYRDNHVAGSDRYGYWFDLQVHGMGANADTSICPENMKVGQFIGNHAHSTGRYGLRLFHQVIPRKFPCRPIKKDMKVVYENSLIEDVSQHKDPYWENPAITAEFKDFTGWKCGRNGAIAERMGDVHWLNFKAADNKRVDLEMSMTDYYGENRAQIDGALVIGMSNNIDPEGDELTNVSPRGVEMPQREFMTVKNVRFYNFNWNDAAALGTCSHCVQPEDMGARTSTISKLWFDPETVTRRIMWNFPGRAILYDLDGSTTGKGPNSWATPYFKHNDHDNCSKDEPTGSLMCDNTVQVRRLEFKGFNPSHRFKLQAMRILQFDDAKMMTIDREEYLKDVENYTSYPWLKIGWTVPFVTGHKYKLHWGTVGLDWDQMQIELSERWAQEDKSIYFVHNFTDVRQQMDTSVNGLPIDSDFYKNDTIGLEKDYQLGNNVLYNETEVREFHWIVNGKQPVEGQITDSRKIKFVAHRCIGSDCFEVIPEGVECAKDIRLWSDPKSWDEELDPEKRVASPMPLDGENLIIKSGWNMHFDLAESPIFDKIEINGCLSFADADLHLRAKKILIRGGEFNIGTKEKAFTKQAKISLFGDRNEPTIAIEDQGIEAGSKIIANIGVLNMFGKERKFKMTRLTKPANIGDTEIFVDKLGGNVDLVEGDRIALPPTDIQEKTHDTRTVAAYDKSTGKITLDKALDWYHFGAEKSTAEKYSGVDIRGEVLSLSRNIKIIGEELDRWGCQILTADIMELDGTFREGKTTLDSIEIQYGGQKDTRHAAIRFEGALTHSQSVKNSAIHEGPGWMVNGLRSKNMKFQNNVFWGGNQVGVGFNQVMSTTFDNNFVGWVTPREDLLAIGMATLDVMGGALFCSLTYPSQCPGLRITNNICAGTTQQAFTGPGHDCDKPNTNFVNNVAHSINGGFSGNGFVVYPDPSKPEHKKCFEVSGNAAYKCADAGIFTNFPTQEVRMHDVVVLDSAIGAGAMAAVDGKAEYKFHASYLTDSVFYGTTDSPDCPDKEKQCKSIEKAGITTSIQSKVHSPLGMELHPKKPMHCPLSEQVENGSWGGKAFFKNLKFIDYPAVTAEGAKNLMIKLLPKSPDFITLQHFEGLEFFNCDVKALTHFFDPPMSWANLADCGDFPCTGPKNTIFSFKDIKWTGTSPQDFKSTFSLIPWIEGYTDQFPDCERMESINGHICTTPDLGILVWESQDPDSIDRSIQPILIRYKENEEHQNKLNSYMDHNCDSFYNSQQRISRFPGLVYAGGEELLTYEVFMTGTPPNKMRWKLDIPVKDKGFMVKIAFPSAQARAVLVDGKEVPYNEYQKKTETTEAQYGPVTGKFCGENRYVAVKNILEFYVNGECELEIAPRDAIMTEVRMEWTMNEFFDNGGTTTFIDRLCASLGIHASTVKVVGVFEGSLTVNYEITPQEDEPLSIAQIQARQTEQFATGTIDLGAPVLDVIGNGEKVVSDGVSVAAGFKSVVLHPTSTNQGSAVWLEWFEPWLWESAQVVAVDVPAEIIYNGLYGGLTWLWSELAVDVEAYAAEQAIHQAHEEHVPNVAPQEGIPEIRDDDGEIQGIDDESDTGGL